MAGARSSRTANGRPRVADVMERDFVSVRPDERLDLVEDVMRLGRIRHMPVIDRGRLVGIVTQRDLLSASLSKSLDFEAAERRRFMESVTVDEVMTLEPEVIGPEAPLRDAAVRMIERKIGCLPVVDGEERVIGIITETDLIASAYSEPPPAAASGEESARTEEAECSRAKSASAS